MKRTIRVLATSLTVLALTVPAAAEESAPTAAAPTPGAMLGSFTLDAGNNAVYDPSTNSSCGSISGADTYTPVNDGILNGNPDAFDGGLFFGVNGVGYRDPDDKGKLSSEQYEPGAQKVKGLVVSRIDTALPGTPTLRSLIALRNPSSRRTIKRTVTLETNYGSDDATGIRYSSAGGATTYETSDVWIVTSDNPVDVNLDDPAVLMVFHEEGKYTPKSIVSPNGIGCVTTQWTVRIPKGATRYMLFFAELHSTAVGAETAGINDYADLDAAHLTDISQKVRKHILNWRAT